MKVATCPRFDEDHYRGFTSVASFEKLPLTPAPFLPPSEHVLCLY